jgi:hypothetical protein
MSVLSANFTLLNNKNTNQLHCIRSPLLDQWKVKKNTYKTNLSCTRLYGCIGDAYATLYSRLYVNWKSIQLVDCMIVLQLYNRDRLYLPPSASYLFVGFLPHLSLFNSFSPALVCSIYTAGHKTTYKAHWGRWRQKRSALHMTSMKEFFLISF